MNKKSLQSSLLLFLAAFIWGVAFVAQSVGMDYMGPYTFNGARFIMGSMVLLPLVLYRRKSPKVDFPCFRYDGNLPGGKQHTVCNDSL